MSAPEPSFPASLNSTIMTYERAIIKAMEKVYEIGPQLISLIRGVLQDIANELSGLANMSLSVSSGGGGGSTQHCVEHILLALASLANEAASNMAGEMFGNINVDVYKTKCELKTWEKLYEGAVDGEMEKCPFCQCEYIRNMVHAMGDLLQTVHKLAGVPIHVMAEIAYAYCVFRNQFKLRNVIVEAAYVSAGNIPGADSPSHPYSLINTMYDHTIEDFEEVRKQFEKILEKYGGEMFPMYEGPPFVTIKGYEFHPPPIEVSETLQVLFDQLLEPAKEILHNLGLL